MHIPHKDAASAAEDVGASPKFWIRDTAVKVWKSTEIHWEKWKKVIKFNLVFCINIKST
jgi:hypothetical protein